MEDLVIYTYGSVEQASVIFNAIASVIKNGSYQKFLVSIFTCAAIWATFEYAIKGSISTIITSVLTFILFLGILVYPTTTVTLHNNVALKDRAVGDMPLGLALPASFITRASYGMTSIMEQAFALPDDHKYTKTGYLFASSLVRNTSQLQIPDPAFKESLKGYIKECVFYDIHLGSYTIKDLLTTNDVWALITERPSPNRSFLMNNKIMTCRDGVKELSSSWKDVNETTLSKYAKLLVPGVSYFESDMDIKPYVQRYIESSFKHLTGLSKNSSDLLRQILLVNAIEDSAINNPELGMLSYTTTRANAQKTISNFATSIMSSRWLPAMYSTIEFMIYGLFIILIPICLLTGGINAYVNYLFSLVWVTSWPIVYAILHFGSSWVLQAKCQGLGLSFYDLNNLTQIQYDTASIFAYFTNLVPFITAGVLWLSKRGLESTFTQMSQLVGGSTQSLAMAASGEAVTGNISLGNTSFDNHSLYNTNAFKHNANMEYFGGGTTAQLPGGTIAKSYSDGSNVYDMSGTVSNLPLSASYTDRLSETSSAQYDKAVGASINDHKNLTASASSMSRSLHDIGTNISQGTSLGESFRVNTTGGYADSASKLAQEAERFAHDRNISSQEATRLLIGAYGNASGHVAWNSKDNVAGKVFAAASGFSGGGQITVGAKGEADHTTTSQLSENQVAAMDFVKNNGLSNTIEHALRGVKENAYASDLREGRNLTDSLSASYDSAVQSSNSYSAHIQEAENLRELSSYIKDNSAAINYNSNQQLLNYIASQPRYSGQGAMGENQAEALIREEPSVAQAYAERFISSKVKNEVDTWRNKVSSKASEYNSSVSSRESEVHDNYNANKSSMSTDQFAQYKNDISNSNVKNEANNLIDKSRNKILERAGNLDTNIRNASQKIKDTIEG